MCTSSETEGNNGNNNTPYVKQAIYSSKQQKSNDRRRI
jgi:hypothetical protein